MDDLFFATSQDFWYDSFDTMIEGNCRLNTDFEERDIGIKIDRDTLMKSFSNVTYI